MSHTLVLHWTTDEPTQGSKIDQVQKGAMAVPYEKKLGACDTPKINASVEGKKLRVYTRAHDPESFMSSTTLSYSQHLEL